MKPVSLEVAFRPLLFVCFISGVYTMQVQHHTGRKALAVFKRAINFLFPFLSCFCLILPVIVRVNRMLIAKKENESSIASLYLASFMLGEIYLAIVFSTVGSCSLGRFFRLFRAHCARFERQKRHFGCVLRFGILAVFILVVHQFLSANAMYRNITSQCTVDKTSFLWPVFALNCLPPVVWLTTHFISQIFFAGFMLYMSVWRILFIEASDLMKIMKETEQTTFIQKPDVLERFRLRHGELCDLITSANKCLRHIIAAVLGSGVPCILFVLHGFVFKQLDGGSFASMSIMFVGLVAYIVGVLLTGIVLHLKMHQPTDLLYQLNIENMAGKGAEVVTTFLSRLQGPPIGFNVYHLFTIDTSTILMVCGTILTYAVVIIQFQPTGDGQGVKPEAHVPTQTPSAILDTGTVTTLDTLTTAFNATVM